MTEEERKRKYRELIAQVAMCYSAMHYNARTNEDRRVGTLPRVGYERQMFKMMLKTMDEIDAIDPALLDITTAKPLDLVARSPQELFDLLTGEKGALAPPSNELETQA